MTPTPRDAFLQRVRQAVGDGNRSGAAASLPERGDVGVGCVPSPLPLSPGERGRGEGTDLIERFCTELGNAGGQGHVVHSPQEALTLVFRIVEEKMARRILLKSGPLLEQLGLPKVLSERGLEVIRTEELHALHWRDPVFAADLGISCPAHLLAETGSVAMFTSDEPRCVSLLPPVNIVLARSSQIVPDLFDLFKGREDKMPSCLTLITGPSKTGDIELKLVTGVHGPGELHVIIGIW